ncbi:hypothetical protein [Mycobacterium sp. IS-1742]|uniref:hypothetical protein n=1 Tax=Mycobacterium sp. IS-1742 TaxID=1772285 RepID=UPI001E2DA345|nr:hypothetical protein [Mycobacterium sp. IS-1742]
MGDPGGAPPSRITRRSSSTTARGDSGDRSATSLATRAECRRPGMAVIFLCVTARR